MDTRSKPTSYENCSLASVSNSSSSQIPSLFSNTASSRSNSSRHLPVPAGSAPLPSPSASASQQQQQHSGYFGAMSSGPSSASFSGLSQLSQQQQQQQGQQVPAAFQQHAFQTNSSTQHVGQRGDGQGAPVTAPFLQDFSLVAEAAKRAQMACLARDLGEVGL